MLTNQHYFVLCPFKLNASFRRNLRSCVFTNFSNIVAVISFYFNNFIRSHIRRLDLSTRYKLSALELLNLNFLLVLPKFSLCLSSVHTAFGTRLQNVSFEPRV